MSIVYLDNAATTPLDPRVRAAMEPWLGESFGNPSSRHRLGVVAAEALDGARARIAAAVGARPEGVVLTSGGTEANNLAVTGVARRTGRRGRRRVVLGPAEHPSVREPARALAEEGCEVVGGRLDERGDLDLEHLAGLLDEDVVLVALMLVQNELGTVYPVGRAAEQVRARAPRAHLHVDAVQALGKLPLSLVALGADSLAVSAHKVHGPQGAGALVLAEGARPPRALLLGGGQEGGLRSGTENVAASVGLGAAAERAAAELDATRESVRAARAVLESGLARLPDARVLAAGSERVAAILSVHLPGLPAEVRVHHLEAHGVYTSPGAACQSRKREPSAALAALGLRAEAAREVLRLSLSRETTADDAARAVDALLAVEAELGSAGRRRGG